MSDKQKVICKHENVDGTDDSFSCCNEDGEDYCKHHHGKPEACKYYSEHSGTTPNWNELGPKMHEMLKRMEWMPAENMAGRWCPCCDRYESVDHASNCELDNLIRRGEGG